MVYLSWFMTIIELFVKNILKLSIIKYKNEINVY